MGVTAGAYILTLFAVRGVPCTHTACVPPVALTWIDDVSLMTSAG